MSHYDSGGRSRRPRAGSMGGVARRACKSSPLHIVGVPIADWTSQRSRSVRGSPSFLLARTSFRKDVCLFVCCLWPTRPVPRGAMAFWCLSAFPPGRRRSGGPTRDGVTATPLTRRSALSCRPVGRLLPHCNDLGLYQLYTYTTSGNSS